MADQPSAEPIHSGNISLKVKKTGKRKASAVLESEKVHESLKKRLKKGSKQEKMIFHILF